MGLEPQGTWVASVMLMDALVVLTGIKFQMVFFKIIIRKQGRTQDFWYTQVDFF